MHSSKNPAAAVPLHPPLLPAPPLPRILVGWRGKYADPHPFGDLSHLPKGAELQAFPPPRIQEPKAATPRRCPSTPMGHLVHTRPRVALRPQAGLRRAWTAGQSSRAGPALGAGLTLQVAHVSPHPLLLLLVPHPGVEPLFQAPQGPLCLPQTPLQVHADLHLSLRGEARRGKWVLAGQLPSLGGLPRSPVAQRAFSPPDWDGSYRILLLVLRPPPDSRDSAPARDRCLQ